MFRNDASYSEYDIQVEHYIVSTGFAEVIRGMELMNYVDDVWGCELMEAPDADNQPLINEIVYTIDNTTKTRAIFEINKGIGKIDGIDVNSKIPQELRRVKDVYKRQYEQTKDKTALSSVFSYLRRWKNSGYPISHVDHVMNGSVALWTEEILTREKREDAESLDCLLYTSHQRDALGADGGNSTVRSGCGGLETVSCLERPYLACPLGADCAVKSRLRPFKEFGSASRRGSFPAGSKLPAVSGLVFCRAISVAF